MNNLFVELLQVSLGTREVLTRAPKDGEWNNLFVESRRQGMEGVLLNGIEHLPDEIRPPKDLLLQWIGLAQMIESTHSLHEKRASELTKRFQDGGFESCVLKGIGTAQLYPRSTMRLCGDIDLWVNGRRKDVVRWLNTQCKLDSPVWHHEVTHFYNDVETEIHIFPTWLYNPLQNYRLQRFFEQKKKTIMVVCHNGYNKPTVDFEVVFSLVHSFHHFLEEGVGLRHVVDYFYILKSLPAYKKEGVVKELKRFCLLKLASAMMWILQQVCGMSSDYLICEPNEKEGRFLLDEIMRGGNFGHYRNDKRKRNTVARMLTLLPHYPSEVLWVVPWKFWHKVWRMKVKALR